MRRDVDPAELDELRRARADREADQRREVARQGLAAARAALHMAHTDREP